MLRDYLLPIFFLGAIKIYCHKSWLISFVISLEIECLANIVNIVKTSKPVTNKWFKVNFRFQRILSELFNVNRIEIITVFVSYQKNIFTIVCYTGPKHEFSFILIFMDQNVFTLRSARNMIVKFLEFCLVSFHTCFVHACGFYRVWSRISSIKEPWIVFGPFNTTKFNPFKAIFKLTFIISHYMDGRPVWSTFLDLICKHLSIFTPFLRSKCRCSILWKLVWIKKNFSLRQNIFSFWSKLTIF